VDPDDVILTSSTSEAFAVLLKLLCRAGDRVLVPRPSYPLLDWLAELEATEPVPYTIAYDGSGGFHIDAASLRASIEPQKRGSQPARAIFAVHPNNPTGSYVREPDRTQLLSMASESECPLIVDEVYLDYPLSSGQAPSSFAGTTNAPVFVVSGLSKLAGLPQMKLAWIVVGGEPRFRGAASKRLEHITDQYLSVGTPVQHALPSLLESTADLRRQIRSRIQENRESVARALESCTQATLWPTEGGWYAVIQLPAIRSADTWALLTLRECSVHVHPGTLFGFPYGSFVVVSLLTEVRVLREGLLRLAKFLNRIDVPAME
jgi:aspartate/methionine/tyrosine aminotransferase